MQGTPVFNADLAHLLERLGLAEAALSAVQKKHAAAVRETQTLHRQRCEASEEVERLKSAVTAAAVRFYVDAETKRTGHEQG